jgi:lathosterol oxidase|uniref:sterol desaturase family protein n=1 Tax=Prosthecobacter sp. TaxID=1965333 RepID=UPI00378372EA
MLRDLFISQSWPKSVQMFFGIAVENWLRYALVAGIAWLLAYVIFKKRWRRRKIIQRHPAAGDVRREMKWSVLTALVYGLVGVATILIGKTYGWQMYRKIDSHGWLWFVASIGIAIVVHDTWFYWTHRLMHHRRLFRLFHRVHHESTNPSPWAAYSFAPLEAFMQACIFPLLVFTVPMHPLAFFAFMIWQIVFNVLGHTGYEYFPSWLMKSWLGKILNTPTNHVQHHEKMRGNYGLYFNYWDRLMGTNHKDYEARFHEVTSRS